MDHIGPFLFLTLRCAIAALALAPFAWLEHRRQTQPHLQAVGRYAVLGGVVFLVAGAIQQYGLVTASVTNGGFLTSLHVVATPFVFWLVRGRAPTKAVWLAVLFSAVGAWLLSGGVGTLGRGDALVASSAALWAVHIVVTGESSRAGRPMAYICLHFLVVAGLALPLAVLIEPISMAAIWRSLPAVLYVGLLSSAATFGLMALALRHIAAPRASLLLCCETVIAALAGYALLGERLAWTRWAGAALILFSVLIVRLRDSSGNAR